MNAGTQTESRFRAKAQRIWLALCLVFALLSLSFLSGPAISDVHSTTMQVVSSAADSRGDCDHGHPGMQGHCYMSTACSAQAQTAPGSAAFDAAEESYPKAASREVPAGLSLPPNLRPPKHSNQV